MPTRYCGRGIMAAKAPTSASRDTSMDTAKATVAWLPVTQKEADPEAKTAGLGSERGTDATTVC